MFSYIPLGTNLYKSQFEMAGRYTGWNIYDGENNLLFFYDDGMSLYKNTMD